MPKKGSGVTDPSVLQQKHKATRRHTQTAESVALTDEQLQIEVRAMPVGDAAHCIGKLARNVRLCGLTWGQFSLLDLMKAVLEQIGPADCLISAWTVGIRDGQIAGWWLRTKLLRSLKIWVDPQFPDNEPAYCERLVQVFGGQTFTLSNTHAKFVVLTNEKWNIVIRSSMNLNRNPRLEQFDLDDSPVLARFLLEQHARFTAAVGPGVHWSIKHVREGQKNAVPAGELAALVAAWEQAQIEREQADAQIAALVSPAEKMPSRLEMLQTEFARLNAASVQAARKGAGAEKVSAELRKVHAEIMAMKDAEGVRQNLTPAQAEEQLLRLIEAAPRATKYAIYRQLSEIPGFRAAVEGDDEEEEAEAPGALVVHDGGRAR